MRNARSTACESVAGFQLGSTAANHSGPLTHHMTKATNNRPGTLAKNQLFRVIGYIIKTSEYSVAILLIQYEGFIDIV